LLAIWIVAERSPTAAGSKRTSNVVEAPTPSESVPGCAVTANSPACVPVMVTGLGPVKLSTSVPVFRIVKVRVSVPPTTSTGPKSV